MVLIIGKGKLIRELERAHKAAEATAADTWKNLGRQVEANHYSGRASAFAQVIRMLRERS